MHLVDLLEEALGLAMNSGFDVRQEWLNENGGGACRIGQQRVLFVDLSLSAQEQLEQIVAALKQSGHLRIQPTNSLELKRLLSSAENGAGSPRPDSPLGAPYS